MELPLTKKQFFDLLRIVYLGNWMANAIHDGSKDDPADADLEKIEDYIYSFAKTFGFENYFEYDKKSKRYFPTRELDELVEDYIDEYNEDNFWDELFYRMYGRDFGRVHSRKDVAKMTMEERFAKEEPFREKWDEEINEHGVERLEIKDK